MSPTGIGETFVRFAPIAAVPASIGGFVLQEVMRRQVNERLPASERMSFAFSGLYARSRHKDVCAEHRRIRHWHDVSVAVFIASVLLGFTGVMLMRS